jgi:hypothetical protein
MLAFLKTLLKKHAKENKFKNYAIFKIHNFFLLHIFLLNNSITGELSFNYWKQQKRLDESWSEKVRHSGWNEDIT